MVMDTYNKGDQQPQSLPKEAKNTTEIRVNGFYLPFLVPTTGTRESRGGLRKQYGGLPIKSFHGLSITPDWRSNTVPVTEIIDSLAVGLSLPDKPPLLRCQAKTLAK